MIFCWGQSFLLSVSIVCQLFEIGFAADVNALLSSLSLEEKIGQMNQMTINAFIVYNEQGEASSIDFDKVRRFI
jgi:hypothetical protein